MLVLQVVVQAKAFGGEMFADHRHPEIGPVLAAVNLWSGETQMAGLVGQILYLAQQRLPLAPRQPAIIEIGARPFAAVIEEADIIVLVFQRLDRKRNEAIKLVEIGDQVSRQCKIQGAAPTFSG